MSLSGFFWFLLSVTDCERTRFLWLIGNRTDEPRRAVRWASAFCAMSLADSVAEPRQSAQRASATDYRLRLQIICSVVILHWAITDYDYRYFALSFFRVTKKSFWIFISSLVENCFCEDLFSLFAANSGLFARRARAKMPKKTQINRKVSLYISTVKIKNDFYIRASI